MFIILNIVYWEGHMLAAQFGGLIRNARQAKGMKQVELAQAAKVSRTILSKLEQDEPRPVQTDLLDRIFQALDIKPELSAVSALDERRRARLEQRIILEQQRNRHFRLAVELATNRKRAQGQIAKARSVVELWRLNHTCSPLYIKRWSELLALPPGELAERMASLGEWENALFQNTPWSWAWN